MNGSKSSEKHVTECELHVSLYFWHAITQDMGDYVHSVTLQEDSAKWTKQVSLKGTVWMTYFGTRFTF